MNTKKEGEAYIREFGRRLQEGEDPIGLLKLFVDHIHDAVYGGVLCNQNRKSSDEAAEEFLKSDYLH